MGGCGSREKGPLDKTSLNTKEIEKCKSKFRKLSRVQPGQSNKFIALEGFQQCFSENQDLGKKVFRWIKSQSAQDQIDLVTLVLSMELLTKAKSEIYAQSFQFKNLEQYQLILLISILNPDVMKKDEFKNTQLSKLEVSYLQAGIYMKEILNMTSRKGQTLSVEDDLAAKLLVNNIFGERTTSLDLPSFCNALKYEAPIINQTIRRYFAGKFTNSLNKIRLPDWSEESQLINDQILGLFFVSNQWLTAITKMQLLYRYNNKQGVWNFDEFAESLLSARTPTIILFRHTQVYQKHEKHPFQHSMDENLDEHHIYFHFGLYSATLWKLSPEVTGDVNSTLFSVVPRYKQFSTQRGEGQAKYAVLSKNLQNQQNNPLKQSGLAIGGSGYENHRLWIDAQDLKQSYMQNEDKTFQKGFLCTPHTTQLNLEVVEVWGLEQVGPNQSMPVFRQTQINHISKLVNENPDQSKFVVQDHDVNNVLDGLRKSQTRASHGPMQQSGGGFQVEKVHSSQQK